MKTARVERSAEDKLAKVEQYAELRRQGWTYQRIAEKFGCSHQNIAARLAGYDIGKYKGFSEKRCVYAGLRKWLNENRCSLAELLRRIYGHNACGHTVLRYRQMLKGESQFVMSEIESIIRVTGLPYEELFRKEGCTDG